MGMTPNSCLIDSRSNPNNPKNEINLLNEHTL